ncbi:MAG: NAD(P)-dependent oxidoreductase [Sphingomonadales bacterium]|nr:NAD(P)-dependent oxidoreductase [Sphingomonadales bacterium]
MEGRVIVTGAGGLLGGPAIAALRAAGFHVIAVSRSQPIAMAHETVAADLLDPESRGAAIKAARATHLLHLAWHSGNEGRWTAPENQEWAHATKELGREFAAAGGGRAVFAGSCAEYDWSFPVLSESTPLKPRTRYGEAKAEAGEWLTLVSGLFAGQLVECTDGLQERDFLHTSDVGRALTSVLAAERAGAVNIGSGIATPVRDVIRVTAELIGRPDLVRLGARPRPDDDPPKLVADIATLASTGFRPTFGIRDGLEDVVDAARELLASSGRAP